MSEQPISRQRNRYEQLLEKIFFDHYREGDTEVAFGREELHPAADMLGIERVKNLGDAIYAMRYRTPLPESIRETQPEGLEWIIEGAGRSRYAFRLVKRNRIEPRPDMVTIKVPNATPEIIAKYAMSDEQALLAKVRYNRLIDIFLGITTYSLQNHLRSTLSSGSQVEIDEIYVGLDRWGSHYVVPVQAKGGNYQISVVQTRQDITWCRERFPDIAIRSISTQFMAEDRIALFELTVEGDEVRVVDERHYQLVPADQLDEKAIRTYRT